MDIQKFIFRARAESDFLTSTPQADDGSASVQTQSGSLGARFARLITGQKQTATESQLLASQQFIEAVFQYAERTGHGRGGLVALEQAGIDGSKPITLRQVNQVIQGLGLIADDFGGAGAPTAPGRHDGIVTGQPDHRDVDGFDTLLQRISPGLNATRLNPVFLVESNLFIAATLSLSHRALHGISDPISIQNCLAFDISSGSTNSLNQATFGAQEAFFVCI